ncbi:MAG: serine hydrolase domain-containing protein, partial [Pseudomonadales bacterium]
MSIRTPIAALKLALACAAGTAAFAVAAPTPQELAIAAGYKAQFTCSATFNAGKPEALIAAQELSHYGDHLNEAMALVGDAVIDQQARRVSVRYNDALPPRISAWREYLGCTGLPQGADAAAIKHLPTLRLRKPSTDLPQRPWPSGDALPPGTRTPALDAVFEDAFSGSFGGVTSAVLVAEGELLRGERYAPGYTMHTSQRTWSVAKSLAATVLGAAVQQRLIKVDAPTGLQAWQRPGDPRRNITLANLLHMSSGLDNRPAGNRTDNVYFGGGLVAQHATKNALNAAPGSLWSYANNDTMLAMRALRERMKNDRRYLAFPFKALLHPIGMFHTHPETDWDGDFVMSSQVWTTSRDLARLGLLYLNDGVWNGKRILPK